MPIRVPTNYDAVADIIADLDDMADSIQDELDLKVDKEQGKGLSTNDYSTSEKEKLAGVETGAEVNLIESVKVNGTALTITNKAVDVPVPTKTSDLTNDSGFGTYSKPSGGIPSTDLSSAVQTSLGKADTAVQDVSGKEDKSNKVTSINENSTDTQYPSAKAVYEENKLLKDQIPNGTVEGTNVQITDSSNLPIEDGRLEGNTSQVQYEGRNLLSSSFEQGARSNENGTTLISSYQYVRTSNPIDVQPSTQYVCSLNGGLKNGNVHFYNNDTFISQTSTSSAFSTPNDCNKINIQFYNSIQITPASMGNAQLEQGSSIHDFEPYVGGQPSPNPSYPQDIHRVTGNCNEKFVNKNLFDKNRAVNPTFTSSIATALQNYKSTGKYATGYTSNGTSLSGNDTYWTSFTPCQSGETYAISNTLSAAANFSLVCFLDNDGNVISQNSAWSNNTYIHTATSEEKYIMCGSKIEDKDYILIELGSSASSYVPHAEQNAPLTLGNIELCKIGDYQDYLFKNVRTLRSGRVNPLFNPDLDERDWYKYEAIGEKIFNNNDTFYSVSEGYYINFNAKATTPKNILCNLYVNKLTYSTFMASDYAISLLYNANQLYIRDKDVSSANELLTKLINNNGKVVYIKATPTYTKITDTTLIAQLEAYYNSSTYRNVTNIITTGDDLAPIASIVYKKDLTTLFNRLDSLEARVDLLEE